MENQVAAVINAEDRRRAALVAVDMAELDALFADDLVHIHSTGVVHTKSQILAHVEARRAFIAVDRGPLAVRIEGNIAVMAGRMTNHMRVAGRAVTLNGMVTQVLRHEKGRWRFINFQLTLGEC